MVEGFFEIFYKSKDNKQFRNTYLYLIYLYAEGNKYIIITFISLISKKISNFAQHFL